MPNTKALSDSIIIKTNVNFFFKVGNRSRLQSFFCMTRKPLSQGTYMPNIKAL